MGFHIKRLLVRFLHKESLRTGREDQAFTQVQDSSVPPLSPSRHLSLAKEKDLFSSCGEQRRAELSRATATTLSRTVPWPFPYAKPLLSCVCRTKTSFPAEGANLNLLWNRQANFPALYPSQGAGWRVSPHPLLLCCGAIRNCICNFVGVNPSSMSNAD